MLFIIPAPIAMPAAPYQPYAAPQPFAPAQPYVPPSPYAPYTPPAAAPQYTPYTPPAPEPAPEIANPFAGFNPGGTTATTPAAVAKPAEPELLHIPCPNGHVLETPVDMLDQEVLCPQCQAQFLLRRVDSVEYKKKQEEDERIRLAKLGNAWLNWAIVAAVLIGLGLAGLIIMSMMNG